MEKDVTLSIHLYEDADDTKAVAKLDLRGDHFECTGSSRRNPADDPRPVIGEEIAIARALNELQHELLEAAWGKIYTAQIH